VVPGLQVRIRWLPTRLLLRFLPALGRLLSWPHVAQRYDDQRRSAAVEMGGPHKHQANELVDRFARDGQAGDARLLAWDLKRAAADSHTREPPGAFGWYPSGHNSVAAILELDAIHPDATYPEVALPLLTDHMKSTDFGEPDVRDVRLPLGDAVRIRQNLIGEKECLSAAAL
jgi:hypothetical protein